MQKGIDPNPDRLMNSKGGYTVKSAFEALSEKVRKIRPGDIMVDLEPLFEDGMFVKEWVNNFHNEFERLLKNY